MPDENDPGTAFRNIIFALLFLAIGFFSGVGTLIIFVVVFAVVTHGKIYIT